MKKNKIMRLASVLLIAVLLSTSIISGTFAKYVTTGSVTDSARVAKFGITINGSGSLFSKTYYSVQSGLSNQPAADDVEDTDGVVITVKSSNTDNLVAPGTHSDPNNPLKITGTVQDNSPEVDVRITFDLDYTNDVVLRKGSYPDLTTGAKGDTFTLEQDYYPIVYTLSGSIIRNTTAQIEGRSTSYGVVDKEAGTVKGTLAQIKAVLTAINNAGDNSNGIYVNALDSAAVLAAISDLTLSWEWAFEGAHTQYIPNEGAYTFNKDIVDQADTLLGDIAANTPAWDNGSLISSDSYNINVDVTLTVTVTQVD